MKIPIVSNDEEYPVDSVDQRILNLYGVERDLYEDIEDIRDIL